jgi:hypothetical protein
MPTLLNTFLFIEPEEHYLLYGSAVLRQVIEANKQAGQTITELKGSDANPDRIKQELAMASAVVCAGIGHGNESTYTVECTTPFLHANNPDELALMKDRVVLLCSCLTAIALGPALIDAGAVAYTGYKEEFWFYTGDVAGTTRAVQSPFLTEFQFTASLLQGKTTGQARAEQMKRYDEEIAYWITGDGKNHPDAMELARIIEINKSISVFLGGSAISPSPQAGVLGIQVNPAVTFGIASIPIAYLIYKALA